LSLNILSAHIGMHALGTASAFVPLEKPTIALVVAGVLE